MYLTKKPDDDDAKRAYLTNPKTKFLKLYVSIIFRNPTQGEIFVEMEEGKKCHSS
jgi:hypothetical protein